jgi:hypothetical protein
MTRGLLEVLRLASLLGALAGILALPARVSAQVTTASILGTVTDPSGAVVPGAQVKATQLETNFVRSAVTGSGGQYAIKFLPVGSYRLEITAQGFKTYTQTGIILEVNRNARVDTVLQVGALIETVQVSADAPLINTSDATIGRTVDNKEIQNLPLVNRDLYSLLTLTPGVDAADATNPLGSPAEISVVNGSSSGTGSISYYLDGGNNTAGLRNTGNSLPNPDAVQEFRVITNSYSAEFGRFAAGMVDVVTKSGANLIHGSLFEFLRNDALNASNWNALSKPPLRRNQFGGSFGGPIVQDRTFYFGSYSGLRQRQVDFSQAAIVPTALEREGDFSQSFDANNKLIVIKDPLTKQPFTDNAIPDNRLDPTAQDIIAKSIPLPNLPGNHYEATVPHPTNTDEVQFKLDHKLNDAHQLTGSYYYQNGETIEGMQGNLPWSTRAFAWTQQNYNISDTWTVSPILVNQLRLTYVRNFGGRINSPEKSLADFGSKFQVQGTPALPNISVTGYFTLGQAIAGATAGSNYYGLRELLSWTKGRHFLKIGGELSLEKNIHDTLLNNYGTFAFTGSSSARSGNALADFLLGLPVTMNQDAPIIKYDNGWYYAGFVQDDWRIHHRLTLNLGLRYDVQTPFTDPYDRRLAFVLGAKSTKVPTAPLGLQFPGDNGIPRGIASTDTNNIAPRVGLAWDPFGDGKTSVRAAFGLFYGSFSANEWNQTTDFQPFSARQQFNDVKSLTDPYGNLPGGVSPYPYVYDPSNTRFLANASVTTISTNAQSPYTYQLNLSIQRQLASDLSVTAAYVGALGHHWPTIRDLNYPIYGPGATSANVNARRPIQPQPNTYAVINDIESSVNTAYHGLQISAEKRMSRNFSFKGFYAFSKALEGGNEASANGATGWQNANQQWEDRGRTNSDRRHNFVMSAIWNIDYFKGSSALLRGVLNGWALSAIMNARSGAPLTVTAGSDINLDGINNDRANLVGDPRLDPNRPRSEVLKAWFDTAAFDKPLAGQDGTGGRNILDRPGSKNVDLGFFRDFDLRERMSLQFRWEVTNAFNLVNLGGPNTTRSSGAFGTITSAGAMRQMQLGLRLSF